MFLLEITKCTDCICVPSCIGKHQTKLLGDCAILRDHIEMIADNTRDSSLIHVYISDLDRVFYIRPHLTRRGTDWVLFNEMDKGLMKDEDH